MLIEENRNSRRDKRSRKGKYGPQLGGLPLGMSKAERLAQKQRKAFKYNRLGDDLEDE